MIRDPLEVPAAGLTRREFMGAATAALALPAFGAQSSYAYAYVGTYTPNGGGIYLFEVDLSSGAFVQLQVMDIRNPSWLALNSPQNRLYAVSEIDNYSALHDGAIVTYAIDPVSLRLERLGAVSSRGGTPTHLSVHPSGKFVFAANYGGGSVAVFPVREDGVLDEASDIRPSVGPRHRPRAADDPPGQFAVSDHYSPHLHMVAADPSGQFVIANDAGLDLTLVWRLDAQGGRLLPAEVPAIVAPSGSAPRHFAFHPNGRVFYNLYEHDSKVAVYDFDPVHGRMQQKQLVSALPPRFAGSNLSSEILIGADGKYAYAGNRLHNSIAVFSVDGAGMLHMIGDVWVHADYPRSMTIDPTGQFLFSCNQRADSITSFRIAGGGAALQFTGRFEAVGSPAVMVMLHERRNQRLSGARPK
jgi:6-phosphogluconolactonase (cycloisomerase 2 family)